MDLPETGCQIFGLYRHPGLVSKQGDVFRRCWRVIAGDNELVSRGHRLSFFLYGKQAVRTDFSADIESFSDHDK